MFLPTSSVTEFVTEERVAGEFVFKGHHGVAQEHALLRGAHDVQEVSGLMRAEALNRTVAAVADRFCDAVRTAVHPRHDRGQKSRAFRAEFVA